MASKIFILKSDPAFLKLIREEIRRLLEKTGLARQDFENMLLCLGEAVTNSMRHSYHGKLRKKIRVTFTDTKAKVAIAIRDYGTKIDLSRVPEPVLPPEKPGGLGIYFMKTMMDEFEYNTRHRVGNELYFAKRKGRSK